MAKATSTSTSKSVKKSHPIKIKSPPRELSAEERERMIQLAAYHIAERDGFRAGQEQEYWLQGEKQINEVLGAGSKTH